MNLLSIYKKYNPSFVEVILEGLGRIYDINLESNNFNYLRSSGYSLKYLKFISPGTTNKDLQKLISIINGLDGNQYLIIYLPFKMKKLEPSSEEDAFDELIEGFSYKIREEIIKKKNVIENQMGKYDSYNAYPLFFNDKSSLKEFLLSKEEEIEHYFIGNVLLFPINMNWFMHFDYDLGAIHFAYKNYVMDKIKNNRELKNLTFSDDEIDQLIIEANE